jgi:hypothetical protein
VHKLGRVFHIYLQGIREKRKDKQPMLWEWISGASAVGQKWETEDQAMAFYIGQLNLDI